MTSFAVVFQRSDKDDQAVQAEYLVECENEETAVIMALFNVRLRKEPDWAIKSVRLLSKVN